MFQIITISLTLGLISSLHCVGMCGPLLISFPSTSKNNTRQWIDSMIYHAGRIATYMTGGLIVGMIGKKIDLFSTQQSLSVWLGLIIILYVIIPKRLTQRIAQWSRTDHFFSLVRKQMLALFNRQTLTARFMFGLLNGLLPCGMVYLALASALTMGDMADSVTFMAGFGLGTLPTLLTVSMAGKVLHMQVRRKMQQAIPVFLMSMGLLLVLRGMDLGIPYLSPAMEKATHTPSCCTRPAE
jgi:sulfite exporter TauE/SafE